MLTATFACARGMNEELERQLWQHGILNWELARAHLDEVAAVLGPARAQRLTAWIGEAERARQRCDRAWFRLAFASHPWRLWRGYCAPERIALLDIETTGLTPGFDQVTVIGLADSRRARAFVAGQPQGDDLPLAQFPAAIRDYDLLVTFNGESFDLPFLTRAFRDHGGLHLDQPHLDLLPLARQVGLSGGLKEIEAQLGIARASSIAGLRGGEAIALWAAWRQGDAAAYRRLVQYCLADCSNLALVAERLYRRCWTASFEAFARPVDFALTKGQQQSLF
ncbi:MAG: ribonuclease H-like domain-containing protein [Planctomycetota bacterium]|nr:ribonuclease H-like domain-containing protein [Planctomycetota bacterium]MCX8040027.1 ribonuclease H-like domain-containing protein [Planctomycetota bacterium]MDW8372601.1 ribonuclease H-like domain-containing protein [Planctomycetota bacterium]